MKTPGIIISYVGKMWLEISCCILMKILFYTYNYLLVGQCNGNTVVKVDQYLCVVRCTGNIVLARVCMAACACECVNVCACARAFP